MFDDIYHLANALWPVWGMILFLGIAAWAFWPSNKKKCEGYGQIPLNDDKPDDRKAD
jgi:cytochrome c oxidase cbb3-type subunit 4